MDPVRWSDAEMNELERQLLSAARNDRAPDALTARMAQALPASGTVGAGGATAATAAAGKVASPLLGTAGLWGTLGLGLVACAIAWQLATSPSAPESAVAPAPQPPRVDAPAQTPPPSQATTESESMAPPAPNTAHAPVAEDTATPKPATKAAARPPRRRAAVAPDELRAEVALLARARQALRHEDSAQALRVLQEHRSRFGRGTLSPESDVLHIEALLQQGRNEQADARIARFLREYPTHPLRERVRVLKETRGAP